MRAILFPVIICLMACTALTAQTTVVTGSAAGAEGKKISIKSWDDYISFKEVTLASGQVDSSGMFTLHVPLTTTKFAWFAIEYYKGEMYLEPRGTHHFVLTGLNFSSEADMINTNLEPLLMNVGVDTADVLNTSVQLLNIMCNRFLFDHLRDLRTRQFALYLDSLRTTLDSLFSGVENAFFSAYKTYRFASLEIMNGITPTDGLMEQYLLRRNVLTDHVEYMGFFVSFFESYFGEVGRPVHMDILRQVVNTDKSYKALLDSLRLDYYFHSEELREAVSLTVLHHLYGTRGFSRDHILFMLRQAEKECGYPKHRSIASNILDMLTRFEQGSPAATFALPDHEEDTVRLHDLKGKFVYLIFFKTWNIAALNEMEMLRKLAPKYEHSVEFVGICCDREPMKMYHFVRDKKFPWRFLHFCNDHDLLEAYAVKSYPHFVLLDRQGRYIANPALFPSKNIEAKLIECIRQEATD